MLRFLAAIPKIAVTSLIVLAIGNLLIGSGRTSLSMSSSIICLKSSGFGLTVSTTYWSSVLAVWLRGTVTSSACSTVHLRPRDYRSIWPGFMPPLS